MLVKMRYLGVVGIVMMAIAIMALILIRNQNLTDTYSYSFIQHKNIWQFMFLLGLFTICYSTQKQNDPVRQKIRMNALEFSFYLLQALLLAKVFAGSKKQILFNEGEDVFFIACTSLSAFICTYLLGLYIEARKGLLSSNIRRRLVYCIGGIIAVAITLVLQYLI